MKSLQSVEPSNVGVETVFGDIKEEVLPAGLHVVNPFAKITNVYLGQQTVTANNSSAASNDLQSVHSNLVVQLSVKDPMQYLLQFNLRLLKQMVVHIFSCKLLINGM